MRDSPRIRRLRSDFKAMERLASESTIVEFTTEGSPPDSYVVRFLGRGAWLADDNRVLIREVHEVSVRLGAAYPRMMPELSWKTPVFHPNVSAGGIVCLGGYGTHWAPSLNLDELCEMLWDMTRYANYDVSSPYNRQAAQWTSSQTQYSLPLDNRPIRDKVAGASAAPRDRPPITAPPQPAVAVPSSTPTGVDDDEMFFIDDDASVVDAEVVEPEDPDILVIE